jgi:hypothetical protein
LGSQLWGLDFHTRGFQDWNLKTLRTWFSGCGISILGPGFHTGFTVAFGHGHPLVLAIWLSFSLLSCIYIFMFLLWPRLLVFSNFGTFKQFQKLVEFTLGKRFKKIHDVFSNKRKTSLQFYFI